MSAQRYTSYMTDSIGPLPYCPGCGHGLLIKALDTALVSLQPDPKNVVIVTDIGCIGLSDRYFTTNAFHGLHGRSITYGCGLKLARPELTVIVLQGDGGCGIGGTHLLNAARRNIGITLIIGNNFNYGMTGGQHSVTTPSGGITSTTPFGNVEKPMDICETVSAAGAAWVYRATAFDGDLSAVLARAIRQPGFAMVDVWELCTAYYSPRNRLRKKDLFDLLDNYKFRRGLITDNPRPEYSEQYHKVYNTGKKKLSFHPPVHVKYPHSIKRQIGIVIAGSAGQKIKSTATLFAEAAMFSGLEATQKDDYPITVMTGHSIAEIIISPQRIEYTAIDSPDYFIVLSDDGIKRAKRRIETLQKHSVILADESLTLPETGAQIVRLPIIRTAKEINRLTAAVIAMASLLKYRYLFPVEAFSTAIATFQKTEIAGINKKAVKAGFALLHK